MTAATDSWAAQIRQGDVRAISRALTAIENGDVLARPLLQQLFSATGRAWKIGMTGAAGTGKSTLANCLAARYRALQKSVGIIAVDPSSPFTGGAILGDRIRMQDHATDGGVFIRSMASRGAWGGLAQSAADAALLLDAAGKEIILLETVGVGQDEVEVVRVADCTLVVVTPGAGDEVQSLKAGLMEIANIFVLNKSDYPEADALEQQLQSVLQLAPARDGRNPQIVRTVATEKKGVDQLVQAVEEFRVSRSTAGKLSREVAYWKHWLLRTAQQRVVDDLLIGEEKTLQRAAETIAVRTKDPYVAADELFESIHIPRKVNPQ
jgi:LAO/AO transport system kinase